LELEEEGGQDLLLHELIEDTGRCRSAEESGNIIDVRAGGKVVVEGLEGGREGLREGGRGGEAKRER